jgi:hypothetical protein
MSIGKGSLKQLRCKRQTVKGTLAGVTGAQIVRRNTSTFTLAKDLITTDTEQTSRRQLMSVRHGPRTVNGALSGIWSPGTYADFLSALLMRDFTAITAITGASITIAGTGPSYTVTRAAGDFLADGAKIGRVIRLSVGTFAAANLNKNLLIIGVTTLVLTVVPLNRRLPLTAEGPIATSTVTFPGKITYVPGSGHTEIYYTAEEWYPDVPYSQRNLDVKVTQAALRVPGSGNATLDLTLLGLDQTTDPAAAYFTTPTVETTTQALTSSAGALFLAGVRQAVITDTSMTITAGGAAADPVVGDDVRPDVFTADVGVTGSFTAYFDSNTTPDLFINETQVSIVLGLTSGTAANADFVTLSLSQVKLTSATPDDVKTGLKRTYNFTAMYNVAGGAALATTDTTIEIQDSQAP